eukprot:COSAG06_NODE_53004_length_302_cov_1.201970_1_plen_45_part_10
MAGFGLPGLLTTIVHLNDAGRQMVVIVDPHLKADDSYHVFSHANA